MKTIPEITTKYIFVFINYYLTLVHYISGNDNSATPNYSSYGQTDTAAAAAAARNGIVI